MAGQDPLPTGASAQSSAVAQHPAVTQSQPGGTQSTPAPHAPTAGVATASAPRVGHHQPEADEADSSRNPEGGGLESATTTTATNTTDADGEQQHHHHQPLPLPAPDHSGGGDADSTTTVEVNGASVSLADKLGPAVINADGTMSRIANWAEMTEIERRNTLRVLGQRNKIRLAALRGEGGGQGQDQGQGQGHQGETR